MIDCWNVSVSIKNNIASLFMSCCCNPLVAIIHSVIMSVCQ